MMSFGVQGTPEERHTSIQRGCSAAMELMERKEWTQALGQLEACHSLLRQVEADSDLRLLVCQNAACCYQRLDLASAALQESLQAVTLPAVNAQSEAILGERIGKRRGLCRTHIQICGLLSQVGDHSQALRHAKEAGRAAHTCIGDSLRLCRRHLAQFKAAQSTAGSESEFRQSKYATPGYRKTHDSVTKATPVLEHLESIIKGELSELKPERIDTRSTLGLQHYSDWIFSFNFKCLMEVPPITLFELRHSLDPYSELSRDSLLEKVCFLTAAYFCIATETAYLSPAAEHGCWLGLSLQVAQDLLPQECPLLEHVRNMCIRAKLGRSNTTGRREAIGWGRETELVRSQGIRKKSKSPEREKLLRSLTMRKSASAISGRERPATVSTLHKQRFLSKSPFARRTHLNN